MKRLLLALFLIVAFCPAMTCHNPTQQKLTVNTLTSLHQVVDASLNGYLDLVVAGKVRTNDVPRVLTSYGQFQGAYNAALVFALGNTNAVPPQYVVDAAASFSTTLTSAKQVP